MKKGSSFALVADKPTGVGGIAAKTEGSGGGGGGGDPKWAVTKLLDVSDFDALVPRPAHRFPFTLDGFQKQAVARLEVCLRLVSVSASVSVSLCLCASVCLCVSVPVCVCVSVSVCVVPRVPLAIVV